MRKFTRIDDDNDIMILSTNTQQNAYHFDKHEFEWLKSMPE